MNKKNNKGFSLVELIVVIAIMAVLVGILAPQYMKYVNNSKVSTDITNVDNAVNAINAAIADGTITATNRTWAQACSDAQITEPTFKIEGVSNVTLTYTMEAGVTKVTADVSGKGTGLELYPNPDSTTGTGESVTKTGYNAVLKK